MNIGRGIAEPRLLSSFALESLVGRARSGAGIPARLPGLGLARLWRRRRAGSAAATVHFATPTPARRPGGALKQAGLGVAVYTVNDPAARRGGSLRCGRRLPSSPDTAGYHAAVIAGAEPRVLAFGVADERVDAGTESRHDGVASQVLTPLESSLTPARRSTCCRWSKAARASRSRTARAPAPGRRPAASAPSPASTPIPMTRTASDPAGLSRPDAARAPRGAGRLRDQGGIHRRGSRYERSNGQGRIHMNVLWEMAAAERVLHGVLEGAKGLIHGVTCGAGMPYRIAEICAHYGVYYYPIVSSARAFRALWKRAYHKFRDLLGGVVYEDPWLAGGHNGLSNAEDPQKPRAALPARARAAPADARRMRPRRDADHHGGRRLVPARMGGLDRQPGDRPDRLPVRHAAAADPGKPDLRCLEAAPADARRRATSISTASARPASIRRR